MLRYFFDNAVVLRPRKVVYNVGRPLDCHRNALEYASSHPGATPYFGWRLLSDEEGYLWWLHSIVVDQDGTVLDSGDAATDPIYVVIPWGVEAVNEFQRSSTAS